MKTIILALNPLEPETWTTHEVENVKEFLISQFDEWPATARIYNEIVSETSDITPSSEEEVKRLGEQEGPFIVVVYPGYEWIVYIVIVIVAVILAVALAPSPPSTSIRNTQNGSPNNELSERSNKPRPNERIPDVFGTVRSTPDLIAVPYKVFQNHEEVEYSFMCIGRGFYDVSDIRDDTTLVSDIAGTSVEIYAPFTSPNSGGLPQLRIGTPINERIYNVVRSNSVNGQVLRPPNDQNIRGVSNIQFIYPNEIHSVSFDFTDKFAAGDALIVSDAYVTITPAAPATPYTANLAGSFTVLSVSSTSIVLSNPAAINANWDLITTTAYVSATLATSGPKWIGPFVLDSSDLSQVFANFVAVNGLFKDNGQTQYRIDITVELEVAPINENGSARGATQLFQGTIQGSSTYRNARALTLKANPALSGRCRVRARRITASDLAFNGTVSDEIKWRDVYSVANVNQTEFGNVTTVQSITYATAGALSIKERKLNALVTRKIPQRIAGSTFTTTLHATNKAEDIIAAVCLDRHIGNRNPAEINFDNIYNSLAEVREYFGSDIAGEFSYTFDKDNLSFEETVKVIADAIYCVGYRRGNIINLSFEKKTQESTLLFNHRNKLPGSEIRTVRFGNFDNFDGVSYEYVDPEDDALVTYYIPEDRSAVNPKEIESLGVRSKLQAHFHAWRAWNKIKYQNTVSEFTATQEADLLVRNDRILVADNTRPDVQDGEVLSQEVLQLTLSQKVDLTKYAEHTIFLQLPDGSIETIGIRPGSTDRKVLLNNAPRLPLALNDNLYARTTYIIVGNDEPRQTAFLVSEKSAQDNFTSVIKAINYDDRYYSKDKDYIDGVISEDGDYI